MTITVRSVDEAKALEGQELGVSKWMLIDQERIDKFAEATDDYQWIHVDAERAKKELPIGSTIAHGYLLTSILPALIEDIVIFEGERAINQLSAVFAACSLFTVWLLALRLSI